MSSLPVIRRYRPFDADVLRAVFMSAVHGSASRHYTPAQCAAWAPVEYDQLAWSQRLERNRPFVVTVDEIPVAFADVQPDGYIDQFFVDAKHEGKGIGRSLMAQILVEAKSRSIPSLYSEVSLRAESLFLKSGFWIEERQRVEVRGQVFLNARMRYNMAA